MLKKKNFWIKLSALFVMANGVLCFIYTQNILEVLPTISAIVILAEGGAQFLEGLKNKDYAILEQTNLEKGIVAIAIGTGILFMQSKALFVVGMFWGLWSMLKSANSFNLALYNLSHRKRYILILIKSVVEFVLSLMLIFDPVSKVGHHVFLLGVELVFEGFVQFVEHGKEHTPEALPHKNWV